MDYPLLNLFLTMLYFFLWIAWLFLLFRIILDIFRSHDLGGWGKAGWTILILFVPFLGVLIYVIARGSSMQERDMQQARDSKQAMDKIHHRDGQGRSAGDQPGRRADQAGRPAQVRCHQRRRVRRDEGQGPRLSQNRQTRGITTRLTASHHSITGSPSRQ